MTIHIAGRETCAQFPKETAIDPINGSDSALGDKDNPLRSFDEYNRRYPNGIQPEGDVAAAFNDQPIVAEDITSISGIEYTGTRHVKKAIIDTFSVKVITPSGEEETWQLFSSAKERS